MKPERKSVLKLLGVGFVAGVLAFLISDCACGRTRLLEARVDGREYKPAWTETKVSTDSDGNTHVSTVHHPETYSLFCWVFERNDAMEVRTSAMLYHTITNNESVNVSVRKGRWTGIEWIPKIER